MNHKSVIKGRGAQFNIQNRFSEYSNELRDDFLEYCNKEGEQINNCKTAYLKVNPKTIVNKITSPDVGMAYSMNPYQGCEHGCIYCYARNTHEFWGYSAGLDFEKQILIKHNAPELLEAHLKQKNWKAQTIVLSGNTDCYQPAEQKFKITRRCLEIFVKYKHPVGIITKNALVLRDLDLLKKLSKDNLILVNVSITSLSEETRRILEPRTATIKRRLQVVKELSQNGIPVNVMMAPIIPSINSHEILSMAKVVAEAGAIGMSHTIVRLNGATGDLFSDWIEKVLPDKANKVLNQIQSCHGGKLNESRFGVRMKGEGQIAKQINDMIKLAKRQYFKEIPQNQLNTSLFQKQKTKQLKLF